LLTWNQAEGCGQLVSGMADAVYVVQEQKSNPPRLGVATETVANGLRITAITAGSVAENAGLKVADVMLEVAAQPAKNVQVLRNVVQRTVPGTWLPLKIKRGNDELEIVARFPARP
jgi:S1-C subfamily serine protease